MKNTIKMIGLITLICFSFFYTDQVMLVVNEQDPIMIKINEVKNNYVVKPTEAIIDKDTIIPGIYGKTVNVKESYNAMRKVGLFKSNLLVYDDILPKNTLTNNYNKYVISGNHEFSHVSLVFTINKNDINKLSILNNKNINLFIDSDALRSNLNKIKNLKQTHIYTYGEQGKYTKDILTISNNLIKNNTQNKSLYCLALEKNKENLEACSNSKMTTIMPTINAGNNAYNTIKKEIKNGAIIYLDTDSKTLEELDEIIKYIKSKGYQIIGLHKLLKENI